MGSEIAWAALTTDMGARLVVDGVALEAALRKRNALEGELADVREKTSALRIRVERIAHADPRTLKHEEWMQTQALRTSIDALWDQRVELQDALRSVEREIEALKFDPARRIALDDSIDDGDAIVDVEALQLLVDGSRMVNGRRLTRKRDFVTPAELAGIAGVSLSEVKRWLNGVFSSRHRGPLPWAADSVPAEWLTARRRIIHVRGIDPDFLQISDRVLRLEEVLATDPPYDARSPVPRRST